ncbi:MAG TPA: type II secretion system F family protein [archaeon]|nr:type II secretion system F family protein [archaeon]
MEIKKLIEDYEIILKFCRLQYDAKKWITLSLISTIIIFILVLIISSFFIKEANLLPIAFAIATLVLSLGYPYMKKETIIDSIESNFSDALKQMADTLKAGDTYESALREVANADYGRLSEEMEISLRRLEEGTNIDSSLRGFSERIDSKLVRRTITIILDSIKTGASLAEVLDDISEDVRDMHKLKEERKSNTQMQFLFMIAAGGIIAPIIFGEITAIMGMFSTVLSTQINAAQAIQTKTNSDLILIITQGYLIIEVIGSGTIMALIRDGKPNKAIIYIPILLLTAFIVYYISVIILKIFLMGAM